MSENILEKLFDSSAKVRLLKLFLRNETTQFPLEDIKRRTQLEGHGLSKELTTLQEIGFVQTATQRRVLPPVIVKVKSKKKGKKPQKVSLRRSVKEKVYSVNPSFIFYQELRNLVLSSSPASKNSVATRLKRVGRIKMIALSGIFIKPDRENLRTDLLIVGDDVSEKKLANVIRNLEAEAGADLQYSLLTSDEYYYRIKMFDRFLLDVLERPHEKIVNKLKD